MEHSERRILRNTLMLFIRMIFILCSNFYIARVVLNVLGVTDYGIYNIVAGIVIVFSFINNALSSGTQRFIMYELGLPKNNMCKLFNCCVNVHLIVAVFVFAISELLGSWLLYHYLDIPPIRFYAAVLVFHISVITSVVQIVLVPYMSFLIAIEKMNVYAYFSIIEAVLKVLVVLLLTNISFDKLITYSFLLLIVSLFVFALYFFYCIRFHQECRYRFYKDKNMYLQLLSFSSWRLFGSMSQIAEKQGINILFNSFGGVLLNAAIGISNQLSNGLNSLIYNFQLAFNPRITKLYAINDRPKLEHLILVTTKWTLILLLFISIPILVYTDVLLEWWLKDVPEYAIAFCRVSVGALFLESISGPLWMVILATGRIIKYQIYLSLIIFTGLLIFGVMLYCNFGFVEALSIRLLVALTILIFRFCLVHRYVGISIYKYVVGVLVKGGVIVLSCSLFIYLLDSYIYTSMGIVGLAILLITGVLLAFINRGELISIVEYLERKYVKNE